MKLYCHNVPKILLKYRGLNESAISTVKKLSTTARSPSHKKVALLFINSYIGYSMTLGDGPANDGILTYNKLKELGYEPYLYFDPTKEDFKTLFKTFISSNLDHIVMYYSGHGSYTHDKNKDEADGRDECLVFKNGNVVDDEIAAMINDCNNCKKLTLIADCCHSGTIFDIPSTNANVTTFSAAKDNQYAAQVTAEHKECGIFTYYMWKEYKNCNNKLSKLAELINKKIWWANHQCVYNHDDELF